MKRIHRNFASFCRVGTIAAAALILAAPPLDAQPFPQLTRPCDRAETDDEKDWRINARDVVLPALNDWVRNAGDRAQADYNRVVLKVGARQFPGQVNQGTGRDLCQDFPGLCTGGANPICELVPESKLCAKSGGAQPVGMTFAAARAAAQMAAESALANATMPVRGDLVGQVEGSPQLVPLNPALRRGFAEYGLALAARNQGRDLLAKWNKLIRNRSCAATIENNYDSIAGSARASDGNTALSAAIAQFSPFGSGSAPFTLLGGGMGIKLPEDEFDFRNSMGPFGEKAEDARDGMTRIVTATANLRDAFVMTDQKVIDFGAELPPAPGFHFRALWWAGPVLPIRNDAIDAEADLIYDVTALQDIVAMMLRLDEFPAGGLDRDDFGDVQVFCGGGQGPFNVSAFLDPQGRIQPFFNAAPLFPRNWVEAILRATFLCVGRWTFEDLIEARVELVLQGDLVTELPQAAGAASTLKNSVIQLKNRYAATAVETSERLDAIAGIIPP